MLDTRFGKSVVFITHRDDASKILVLGHPHAGIQVPKGTIEEDESPLIAALREGTEETGLDDLQLKAHVKTEHLQLDHDKRYIVKGTPVYSRPDDKSFDWAYLRRGIPVRVLKELEGYTQVEYVETEDQNSTDISYQIIGWVPNETISRLYSIHYYHLTTASTLDTWVHYDDNHDFKLQWINIKDHSKLVRKHQVWLDSIFRPYLETKALMIESARAFSYQLDDYPLVDVKNQIQQEYEEIFDLNDIEVLSKRLDYVGIGDISDYLNIIIETKYGSVLAGIRHLGGNLNEPFIYCWPSFKVTDIRQLDDVKPYFSKFKPKYVVFWSRPDSNVFEDQIVQQRFVGNIDKMLKSDLDLLIPKKYYAWYKEEYAAFHKLNPEFEDRITVNSKELMDACLKDGLLYVVASSSGYKGIIAGEKETFLNNEAVYINEIMVSSEYRGKGYANQILGSFMSKTTAKYLTCYIDIENKPSTKTALRSGQTIFSQECMIKIEV